MSDRFIDERGEIRDLLVGQIDAATMITSNAGAIRGNHYHRKTVQWTFVISGLLMIAWKLNLNEPHVHITLLHPGEEWRDEPGRPHAWRAITDCQVLVLTHGPRSGENYENDTFRLAAPLLS